MKINLLTLPGRQAYTVPELKEYYLAASDILCASDIGGSTEEWEEIDLSSI